jgi:dipeptidyl-peptidase-3
MFYAAKTDPSDSKPVSHGLNSRLVKQGDKIYEEVYSSGGLYGKAIDEIIYWLGKAADAALIEEQRKELLLLIEYYRSGDLKKWDEYNLAWVRNTDVTVDYNNGFIETYEDPMGMKATWEAIVNYTDKEATQRAALITANAQWFEDHSPVPGKYRKEKVTGISAKVINIAMLGGDCYPASPLGINLPNSDWIRMEAGSKSVRLANISDAYDISARGNGFLEEFSENVQETERIKKYGSVADAIHTDLHECIGHASGRLAEGTDPNALKNYASALEETRADLVALYFMMDERILELGLLPSQEAARAGYDSYLRNGLITQLTRIKPGKEIEQAHMRCRALISHWIYEKAQGSGALIKTVRNGKTYVRITDYSRVRLLFGELLHEVQRIKSEGDYKAGRALVEQYGIRVDTALHREVLSRYEKLNLAPYTGFINPCIKPVVNNSGLITDIVMQYAGDYLGQMMYYGRHYAFLDSENNKI